MFTLIIFLLILTASFLFAMLGLGGGMVYIPILKWAGLDFKEAVIPLGLLLNGLNTSLALIPYHKAKLVDYKGMWPMGVSAVIFAPIGALITPYISRTVLIILFAILVLIAALKVFYDLYKARKKQMTITATNSATNETAAASEEKLYTLRQKQIIGASSGAAIGFIGGLLGIGGGFIIGPLLMMLGYETKQAAATTAFVVTFSSFAGYLGHLSKGLPLNWLTLFAVLAVLIGSQAGSNFMVKKAKGTTVKLIYGVTLLLIAIKLIIDLL